VLTVSDALRDHLVATCGPDDRACVLGSGPVAAAVADAGLADPVPDLVLPTLDALTDVLLDSGGLPAGSGDLPAGAPARRRMTP
jgi:hypothetical protein